MNSASGVSSSTDRAVGVISVDDTTTREGVEAEGVEADPAMLIKASSARLATSRVKFALMYGPLILATSAVTVVPSSEAVEFPSSRLTVAGSIGAAMTVGTRTVSSSADSAFVYEYRILAECR